MTINYQFEIKTQPGQNIMSNTMSTLSQDDRNYGIDFVRILSMLMVVTLHVLGQGGLLSSSEMLSTHYELIWAMEILSLCACDCFAIVSGYVGAVAKQVRYSNLAALWLSVAFYTVGFTVAAMILSPGSISSDQLIEAFTPVLSGTYWYFTAYFAMFFFIPVLNSAVNNLGKGELFTVIVCVGALFSVLETAVGEEVFRISRGYTCIWLMYLYLIGAYMRIHGGFNIGKIKAIITYFAMVVISWLLKFLCELYAGGSGLSDNEYQSLIDMGSRLIQYDSPTILMAGIAIVCLFKDVRFPKSARKMISFLAPAAFGVYIIHRQPVIWDHFITGKFAHYADASCLVMIVKIILTVLTIYLCCSAIEIIRIRVFNAAGIKKRLQKVEMKIRGRNS